MNIPSYSKVHAFGHREVKNILDGPVVIEEKIDGSQFSFGIIADRLQCRSKGQEIFIDNPEKMFGAAVDTAKHLADRLVPGWVYRAEYLQKPKHNALAYSRIPAKHLILFDVMVGVQEYVVPSAKHDIAKLLGLEAVPTFFEGVWTGEFEFNFLERDSVLGGCKIEGFVIKNYAKFTDDGKLATAKIVSEAFKEKHRSAWKVSNPAQSDFVQGVIESLRTEARWRKAVQHLRERGIIKGEPSDIGPLLKELGTDTFQEEAEHVKEVLFKHFWARIARGVASGFPEWYKKLLSE